MDVSQKVIILKGRKNYVCKTRLHWILSESSSLGNSDIEALLPIIVWLGWTQTGDIEECSGFLNNRRMWIKNTICSDTGFCTTDICSKYGGCFYGKIKKAMFQADIIIVNHSLLMTNILQTNLLPDHRSVIVDEAHNLVRSAYDQFRLENDLSKLR